MFGWLKYIRILREVDGLCFHKKAGIKITLFGKLAYENEAKVHGDPVGKEWYIAPIFWRYGSHSDILRVAIHEVRHRIQWNHPEIHLLTVEDVPEELRKEIRKIEKHIREGEKYDVDFIREIDAKIIERLALPFFSNSKRAFLELMFRRAKSQKES